MWWIGQTLTSNPTILVSRFNCGSEDFQKVWKKVNLDRTRVGFCKVKFAIIFTFFLDSIMLYFIIVINGFIFLYNFEHTFYLKCNPEFHLTVSNISQHDSPVPIVSPPNYDNFSFDDCRIFCLVKREPTD